MFHRLALSLSFAGIVFSAASLSAQTPAPISPHCQKMMMIGCALTKNSKGRNAPAAAKECADLLAQGECAPPVYPMPQKILKRDETPEKPIAIETPPEPLAIDKSPSPKEPGEAETAAALSKVLLEKEDKKPAGDMLKPGALAPADAADAALQRELVTVPPKELIEKAVFDKEATDAAVAEENPVPDDVDPGDVKIMDNVASESELTLPPIKAEAAAPETTANTGYAPATNIDAGVDANVKPPEPTPELPSVNLPGAALPKAAADAPAVSEPPAKVVELTPAAPAPAQAVILPPVAISSSTPAAPEATAPQPTAPAFPASMIEAASIQPESSEPMSLTFSSTQLILDQPNTVTVYLRRNDNNSPVTFQDLKEVRTQKLHLLIIDPALREYHHVFPTPGAQPGEYQFTFTPTDSYFRVFADITTIGSDRNLYVKGVLGIKPVEKSTVEAVTRYESSDGSSVSAVLSLGANPKAGSAISGSVRFVDNMGTPVKNLEPVMGAFGHIAAFSQDMNHIARIRPMGMEPLSPNDRGGPELQFQFEPEVPGFVRLFVQVKLGGKDIYIPFGFTVQ